ncbi:hypothetical protein G6F57_011134 [Rhizopus arrhizus]|uniref:Uncharacterized protein n=1 Tax=Rhizopus oryzae TaxID=64495 RepID=A0A9P7BU79_RHIOR|nr:hypothetical protein G6F23_000523 [Rhizopus arrhizus]KAG1426938.1 hypothetical protein G6F58_001259 [Rhizopus delemar]KAG0766721.1 hypothetical protein G6F24_003386 [Rhizopus arrhizus]KAG0792130.1 hypothetical protein G6F22_005950 [Rhizopus arrhizus]KAG0793355.1 hypothetical protein G6F21_003682 [Rhizopus arrhizus]
MITAKKDPQINIKISKPTIYSADDHSKIIINSNQGGPKNKKRKSQDLNSSNESTTTVSSLDIDTSLNTTFDINGIGILSLWANINLNQMILCSQAHVMLIKKEEVSLNLLKLFGRETIDSIKKNIIVQLNIQVEEISNEIEYSMRVMVKLMRKEINSRQASSKLTKLCTGTMNSSIDDCIMVVQNLFLVLL